MKRTIKRIVALALACVLIASCFAGCSSSKAKYTIGICQAVQHPALDSATEGFKKALTDKLGDQVEFDEQNASGESTVNTTICNQFVANGVDLIMANATDALVAARTATNTIPIVGTSITSYGVALELDDQTATKTGINVTGTADLAPLDKQAAMIQEWFPDAKKIGILYCSAEKNSKYQVDVVSKYLTDAGLEVKEYTCADSNEIASVTKVACDESDVIYIPTDNTLASSAETINNVAEPAKVPIIAGEEGICEGCGIATLSISYYDIGYQAGEMAYEILVNGADPATMDIQFVPEEKLTKKYDAERCKALGITPLEGYEAIESDD
jgi:putative ABC transport system substrate-binding protein